MAEGAATGFPWLNTAWTWDPTFEASPAGVGMGNSDSAWIDLPLTGDTSGQVYREAALNNSFPVSGGYVTPGAVSVAGLVSSFLNQTFPNILAAITGKPVVATTKTATTGISTQIPQFLLVAGVAVLGVALALALFKHAK